jgi:hypothetical protein
LTRRGELAYNFPVKLRRERFDNGWRKSRVAARLLYRKLRGPLRPRDRALAQKLANDPEVENRLIMQALYCLGGSRKYEIDRKLVERGN